MKSGIYNVAGGGIRAAISLACVPVLIRLLGAEEYGVWVAVTAVISILAILEMGLSISTTVLASRELANRDIANVSQVITGTLIIMCAVATLASLALWFMAGAAAGCFKFQPLQLQTAVEGLKIGSLILFARLFQQLFTGIQQTWHRFGSTNLILTTQSMLANGGTMWFAWKGYGTVALIKWQALVSLLFFLVQGLAVYYLLRQHGVTLTWSFGRTKETLRRSSLAWVSTIGSLMFSQFDRVVVGIIGGATVLGIYGAITSITSQINLLSALPTQPLLSSISRKWNHQIKDSFERVICHNLHLNGFIAVTLGLFLLEFAPEILRMVIKSSDPGDLWCFQVATVIYTVYSMNAVGYHVLLAIESWKEFAAIQIAAGAFSLILVGIGVWAFGLKGAIVGNVGYWAIWLLTIRAMAHLSVNLRVWGGTLAFYCVYIFVTWGISVFFPQQIIWRFASFIVTLSAVCTWFFTKVKLSSVLHETHD